MELHDVNAEATWIESLKPLPWEVCQRFIAMEQKSAEAILGRKRAISP